MQQYAHLWDDWRCTLSMCNLLVYIDWVQLRVKVEGLELGRPGKHALAMCVMNLYYRTCSVGFDLLLHSISSKGTLFPLIFLSWHTINQWMYVSQTLKTLEVLSNQMSDIRPSWASCLLQGTIRYWKNSHLFHLYPTMSWHPAAWNTSIGSVSNKRIGSANTEGKI